MATYSTETCEPCKGSGWWETKQSIMTCRHCSGKGRILIITGEPDWGFVQKQPELQNLSVGEVRFEKK